VELVSAWGFEGQTTIPWIKVASSYQGPVEDAPPAYGTGFWVRGCAEYFIVATRGEVELPEHPGALVAHRTRHSAKPEAMQDWAEACWPQFTRRLEMFARRPRAGWHAFGNEGIGTDRLEVESRLRSAPTAPDALTGFLLTLTKEPTAGVFRLPFPQRRPHP
jgi:N6-adenosine-specific RNA methylase IME4